MCGAPKEQTVTQKTELDPALRRLLYGGTISNPRGGFGASASSGSSSGSASGSSDQMRGMGGNEGENAGYGMPAPTGGSSGYTSFADRFDGGGPGYSGGPFSGGGVMSDIANAVTGNNGGSISTPNSVGRGVSELGGYAYGGYVAPQQGIASLNQGQMPMMGGQLPNLSDPMTAATLAMAVRSPEMQYGQIMANPAVNQLMGYAMGGYVEGPGTGRSDSINAQIYQNGVPVQEAALSDGEFVMTERAVRGAGNGDREKGAARMYEMMRQFERGGRV